MNKRIIQFVAIATVALIVTLLWLWFSIKQFETEKLVLSPENETFTINSGSSLYQVANMLERKSIISSARKFVWMTRLEGYDSHIQAGEYALVAEMTPVSLLTLFVSGKVKQYSLTILEGWRFNEMMDAIKKADVLKQTLSDYSSAAVMIAITKEGIHPEGRFFPDTYSFPSGTTDVQFLKRAYAMMVQVLTEEWSQKADGLPLKTMEEALILASIVEKETGNPNDRDKIAGVFIRRLKKGMRLQTDPTVIYGLGEKFDGNLRRHDLQKDTLYNTYTRHGLTPTPIALPGRESIHAVLHPDNSDALYFVAKGNGESHFSATLQEHNEAVIKYQLKGRRKSFSSYQK
jgi:UPF0755 protein